MVYNGFQPKADTVVYPTEARQFHFGEVSLYFVPSSHLAKKALLIQISPLTIPTFQALNVRFSEKIFAKIFEPAQKQAPISG